MYAHMYTRTYVRTYILVAFVQQSSVSPSPCTAPVPPMYFPTDWPAQGVFLKKKEAAEEQYYMPKPLQRRRSKKEKMKATTSPKVPLPCTCHFQFALL